MSMTSISFPVRPGQLRLITTAETTPKAAYEYVDGKRTDSQRRHEDGWMIYSVRDLSGSFLGASVEVTVQTSTADPIPAGAVIEPDGDATLTIRGTTTQGSGFASLAATLAAPKVKVVSSVADALGLATASPVSGSHADKKTA